MHPMSEPQGRGGACTERSDRGTRERSEGSRRLSGAPEANGPAGSSAPRTLAEKIWDAHVVRSADGEPDLLYIDLHLVHEVTSPQAFDGLRAAGRKVRRPHLTTAPAGHNPPPARLPGPGGPPAGPGPPGPPPRAPAPAEPPREKRAAR